MAEVDTETSLPNLQQGACFIYLLGFNVALISEVTPRQCLLIVGYLDRCAATQECHVVDTGQDTPPHHSIQTRGQPIVMLSIDVECHTGIHNYAF